MITSVARRTVVQSVNRASVFRPAVYRSVSTSVRSLSTYYTAAHEYCKVDGNIATVGITDFAQAALGDIVFVDLPDVGDEFEAKDSFGSVESVKAASDVYAPVSGTIVEVNEALTDEPGLVNSNAEDDAWFVKLEIQDESETGDLLNDDQYKELCEKESS
mmetsp:Transcript_9516/g.22191  ORF Transcript_9516/g.22191 Transcript_9516/m.22191 type:complete len:160 (-) Transcript_9516:974-1453(-)